MSRVQVPPPVMVIASIASVQVGAALAKGLFEQIGPTTMVWLRLATAAVVFTLVARPVVSGRSRGEWGNAAALGACLVTMNWAIYQSFAQIPLGMAVTIEFLGPLGVALAMSRRRADLAWVALAGLGVAALGFSPQGLTWAGVAYALLAGAAWGGYIVFSERTGRSWSGVTGLTVASVVAALILTPWTVATAGPDLLQPHVLGIGLAVGLLSSVIPYALEISALRRMPARVFGVLMSLEPAAAALAALVLLREALSPVQWLAIGCVVLASAGTTLAARSPGPHPD